MMPWYTNVAALAGAGSSPASGATWDATNKNANVTLSADKLTATVNAGGPNDAAGLATLAITSGQKVYFEAIRVSGAGGENGIGIGNSSVLFADGDWLGIDGNSLCVFGNTGNLYTGGSQAGSASSFSSAQRVGIAVDTVNKKFWLINITTGGAFGGTYDPATNSGGFVYSITGDLFPGYTVSTNSQTDQGAFQLIAPGSFTNAPPTGFAKYGA